MEFSDIVRTRRMVRIRRMGRIRRMDRTRRMACTVCSMAGTVCSIRQHYTLDKYHKRFSGRRFHH